MLGNFHPGIPFNVIERRNPSVMISNRKLENINLIIQPQGGRGGLFLGDIISTIKDDLISNNKIRAILTVMAQNVTISNKVASHKIIPVKDILEYPIIRHFDQSSDWINTHLNEGSNVLVHCHAGVSRSASIIIAYLIKNNQWNPLQALDYIKQKRERVKPNISFWNQLNQYYMHLNNAEVKLRPFQQQKKQKDLISLKQNICKISLKDHSIVSARHQRKDVSTTKRDNNQKSPFSKVQQAAKRRKIFKNSQSETNFHAGHQIFNRPHLVSGHISGSTIINNNSAIYSSNISPHKDLQPQNKSALYFRQYHQQHKKGMIFTSNVFPSGNTMPVRPTNYYSPFELRSQFDK